MLKCTRWLHCAKGIATARLASLALAVARKPRPALFPIRAHAAKEGGAHTMCNVAMLQCAMFGPLHDTAAWLWQRSPPLACPSAPRSVRRGMATGEWDCSSVRTCGHLQTCIVLIKID